MCGRDESHPALSKANKSLLYLTLPTTQFRSFTSWLAFTSTSLASQIKQSSSSWRLSHLRTASRHVLHPFISVSQLFQVSVQVFAHDGRGKADVCLAVNVCSDRWIQSDSPFLNRTNEAVSQARLRCADSVSVGAVNFGRHSDYVHYVLSAIWPFPFFDICFEFEH